MASDGEYIPVEYFRKTDHDYSSARIRDMPSGKARFSLSVFPESLEFISTGAGFESPAHTILLTNDGYDTLTINKFEIVGDFKLVSPTITTIAVGEILELKVAFTPKHEGRTTGGIYFDTGDAAGTEFVEFSGEGLPPGPTNPDFFMPKEGGTFTGPIGFDLGTIADNIPGSTDTRPFAPYQGAISIQGTQLRLWADMSANHDGDYDADMASKANMYLVAGAGIHLIPGTNGRLPWNTDGTIQPGGTPGRVVVRANEVANYIQSGGSYNGNEVPEMTISGITKASNAVFTVTKHGFGNGDSIGIQGITTGMVEMNSLHGICTVIDVNHFTLGINSSTFTAYTSGGVAINMGKQPWYKDLIITRYLSGAPWMIFDESEHGRVGIGRTFPKAYENVPNAPVNPVLLYQVGARLHVLEDDRAYELPGNPYYTRVALFETRNPNNAQIELKNATSSVTWTSGSGSPENKISATPGSFYTRTDGVAGSTLYVKEIGTGKTGWVVAGSGSSGGTVVDWADIDNKPTTFPPTLPINQADVTNLLTDLAGKASLASPSFTGVPMVPTAIPSTDSPQIASTAFVKTALAGLDVDVDWSEITNKPSTFPPTLPISQSDVTNLTNDMLGLATAISNEESAREAADADIQIELDTKLNLTGGTMSGKITLLPASTGGGAGINFGNGTTPSALVDGDIWLTGSILYWRALGTSYSAVNLNGTQTISGAKTFSAKAVFKASDTTSASFNMPVGVAPSSPVAGDVWIDSNNTLTYRSNTTRTVVDLATTQTISGIKTFSAKPIFTTPTTATASFNTPHGVAPTSPVDGDVWTTTTGLYSRINGVTVGPYAIAGEPILALGTTAQYYRGDKTWQTLDKIAVGLANVDNTSDASKPVSTAQQTALNLKANIAGPTFTGKVITQASAAGTAGFNLPPGAAPSAPARGDIWVTTAGPMQFRTNADLTINLIDSSNNQSISGTKTFVVKPVMPASASGSAAVNIPQGVTPSSPSNGDLWTESSGLYVRINGVTVGPLAAQASGGISDAPNDGSTYGRKNLGWVVLSGGGTVTEAPTDGKPYVRKNAGWDDFTDDLAAKADVSALSNYAPLAGATFTGKVAMRASDFTLGASFNIGASTTGSSPQTPVDGDIWATANQLDIRLGAASYSFAFLQGNQTYFGVKTFTGKVITAASTTAGAGFNIANGAAPSAPIDGDIWITAIGQQFVWRSQGMTFSAVDASSQQSIAGLKTFTTRTTFAAGTTSNASMRVPHGVAPTTPTNGDIWTTSTGLYVQVNGATVGPLAPAPNLTSYAPLNNPVFTGDPQAPTPSLADNDTSIATTGFVKGQGYITNADATTALAAYAPLAGATFTGKVNTPASTAGGAGLSVGGPSNVAPSSPVSGDLWGTNTAFFYRGSSATYQFSMLSTAETYTGAKTFSTKATFAVPTTSIASINVPHGVAPTSPANGDMWSTTAGLYVRINGATVGPLAVAMVDPPADGKLYARKGATWDDLTDDFATKANLSYVDSNFLNLTGGALSGQLIIDYPAVGTKLTVGGNGVGTVGAQISNLSTGVSAGSRLTLSTGIDYSNILMDLANTGAGSMFQILAGAGVTGGIDISAVKVTGPTPTAGDNSTKFATTAFVAGALVPLAPLAGASFTGKVNIKPSDAGSAYFNISTGTGVPPSAPVQGDMWATGSVLGFQGQSITYSVAFLNSTQSFTGTKTFTAQTFFKAGSSGSASINMPHGAAPTTPVDGDVWTTTTGVFARINGATQQVSPGWVQMTQAAYDGLGTKDPNMLYVIFG